MSSVGLSGTLLTKSVFMYVYMRTCVFVYLYLHFRQLGTLIMRSSYHYIFENISYSRHICNLQYLCNCVFAYMYLHVRQMDTLFEVLIPFQKYSTCWAFVQLLPKLYLCICR